VELENAGAHQLRFDTRFAFHFYDMDFCRQAESKGLRMGTWPISVVHESKGAFGNAAWQQAYGRYLEKYPASVCGILEFLMPVACAIAMDSKRGSAAWKR
jgi:hypothetical protein